MVDTRISDLTEGTTLADDDLIPYVDVSDTTMAASGTTKFAQRSNVLGAANPRTITTLEPFGSAITDPVSGEFHWTGIPSDGETIVIRGHIGSDIVATQELAFMYLNGDETVANYFSSRDWGGANSSSEDQSEPFIGMVNGGTSTGTTSQVTIELGNYADTNYLQSWHATTGTYRSATQGFVEHVYGNHDTATAAINEIKIVSEGGSNLNGTLQLYIERTVTVGGMLNPDNTQTLGAWIPVDTIDNTTFGDFDFTYTPKTEDLKIWITGDLQSDEAVNGAGVHIYFSGDETDANYEHQSVYGADSVGQTSGATPKVTETGGTLAPSTSTNFSRVDIIIHDPTGDRQKWATYTHDYWYNTDNTATTQGSVLWDKSGGDAVITSISVKCDTHPTNGLKGKLRMYAWREITVSGASFTGDAGTLTRTLTPVGTVINSTAGTFLWSDIPQHSDGDLVIKGYVRGDVAASFDDLLVTFNGDTTPANYHQQNNSAYNGTASSSQEGSGRVIQAPAGSSPANAYGYVEIRIPQYTSGHRKGAIGNGFGLFAADAIWIGPHATFHDTETGPITSVEIITDNDPTDEWLGSLTMYVERELVITPGKHLVKTIVADGTTITEFDFQSIPAGAKRIWIGGNFRSANNAIQDDIYVYFNNDTTDANYASQRLGGFNGTTVSDETTASPYIGSATAATADANRAVKFEATLEGYGDGFIKGIRSHYSHRRDATTLYEGHAYCEHDTLTTPINQITVTSATSSAFTGELSLYIEY